MESKSTFPLLNRTFRRANAYAYDPRKKHIQTSKARKKGIAVFHHTNYLNHKIHFVPSKHCFPFIFVNSSKLD